MARPLRQDLRQLFAVLRLHGQQDLVGQDGPGKVVLGRQGGEHLGLRLLVGGGEQLRLPAGQISLLHVENGVTALAGSPVQSPDVRIGTEARDHRLLFAEGTDGVNPVPEQRRLLEVEGLRLRLHLGGHVPEQLLAPPLQQLHRLLDPAVIRFCCHLRPAESVAPAHVEVQTGALCPDIPWEFPATGRQPQGHTHRVQGLAGLEPTAEGPKVPGGVIGHLVHQGEAGVCLFGQADEGVPLVVLQQDVVAGHVPLDKGVLQHQGLELAGDEDGVEAVHLRHHVPRLGGVGGAVLEILAHPVFQLLGLAHVDDPACFVHHQIDARRQWQVVGLLPQLFLCHARRPLA